MTLLMKRILYCSLSVLLCACLFGCFWRSPKRAPAAIGLVPSDRLPYVPDELVGTFASEALAEEAAELYGIELYSYGNEVAVFKCAGDPMALIELGEKNGWPRLSLNMIYQAFS